MGYISFWSVLMTLIYWAKILIDLPKATLLDNSKEDDSEVPAEKTSNYVFAYHRQNAGQNHNKYNK
jgi:hypothetical protein